MYPKQAAVEAAHLIDRLERLIRAYAPWPGTFCLFPSAEGKAQHLKVHRAAAVPDVEVCPVGGTIMAADQRLLVSCGSGVLELQEIQLEGKKRMSAAEFLRGHAVEVGTRLT